MTALALPAAKYRCIITWSENVLPIPAMAMQMMMDQVVSTSKLKEKSKNRVQYISSPIDADDVETDTYSYMPLGSGEFRKEGYMFVMPKINPGIKRSYLDHLVFVKE